MKNVKYLLLGGGYTLSRLAEQIEKDSFVITCRSKEKAENFSKRGILAESVDINKPDEVNHLFSKYCNLEVLIDSIPPLDTENTNLKHLSELIKGTNIKRIIYFSTTGVFGVTDGSWVNEETQCNPNNNRSLSRLTAEDIYSSLNLDFSAFRIAAIYGPGRGIGIALKNQTYKMLEGGERWSNRIHVDDIVETCKNCLSLDLAQKLPPVICLSDNKPDQIKNVVKFYCDKFGYKFPDSVSREEAEQFGMHSLFSNQRVDNKLLRDVLGKELLYPTYAEGAETDIR